MGLVYIVAEYCTQSHLATQDFKDACEGIRFTRRFKKYTYWPRLLLHLFDEVLFLAWKAVRYPLQKATGRQLMAFNKTLVWDWKVKSSSPEKRHKQVFKGQSRRRSSAQPLVEDSRDGRSSHDRQSHEQLDGEASENHTHGSAQHHTRDETSPSTQTPTLQLPIEMHSRYEYSQPPSPSSGTD